MEWNKFTITLVYLLFKIIKYSEETHKHTRKHTHGHFFL